ncbi:MAG TPA: hypothetical protein VHV30_03855 [Polyangiaceae bacterium]|jgi:hypothetical protein|nr:hypothetical protein [Polyangiaceae bacterium]
MSLLQRRPRISGALAIFLRFAIAAPLAVSTAAVAGCRGCSRTAPVAEVTQLTGTVSRDYAAKPGAFTPAAVGATFAIGDGLRTDLGAQAKVKVRGGGALDVREDTLLRFLTDAPSAAQRVSLETGTAEIEMGSEGLEFETKFGTAHIEPGAHVRLRADGTQTRFDVLVGSAVVEGDGAPAGALHAGDSVDLGAKPAVDAGAPPPDAAPPQDTAAEDPSAIYADVQVAGVRRAGPRSGALAPVDPGAVKLDPGSRLVVPPGAKIVVRRGAERATVTGAADLVVGSASGALVTARTGRMAVEQSQALIRFDVPGGSITVRGTPSAPASADIVVDGRETNVFSRAGTTELKGRRSTTALTGNEMAWLEDSGGVEKSIVTNEAPLFAMPAGETATVHSLRVPTPVQVRVDPSCGAGAYVEMSRAGRFLPVGLADTAGDSAGAHAVVLSLGEGSHPYRVRCADSPAGAPADVGAVRIVRDSGAQRVPRTPGKNQIPADGRHYSVLYQNLLPEITLTWPDAPAGEALTLKVRQKDHVEEIPLTSATYAFASGKLGDGTYGFWFEAQRDPRLRSLETSVRIGFDNAAPAAEIHEPEDGFTPQDGKVLVSGVAVEGVTVSVGDTLIPLDGQYRFKGDVPVPPGARSIAIRIAHPTRGVHYYLRSVGGS